MLSGAVTYAMVDYCIGSTLWAETSANERIARANTSLNHLETARQGESVCRTTLDRRSGRLAALRSEIRAEDGRLLVTTLGSYAIAPLRNEGAEVA